LMRMWRVDGGIRVLVVDDDAPFRAALGEMLAFDERFAMAGSVASGEAALGFAGSSSCDLVVMDVRMPGMGGVAAAAALRVLVPDVVVVLVSTGDVSDAETGQVGAVFVPKISLDGETLVRAFDGERLRRRGGGGDAGA
jgi:DNA-binding NarL/FixJ family response regulator